MWIDIVEKVALDDQRLFLCVSKNLGLICHLYLVFVCILDERIWMQMVNTKVPILYNFSAPATPMAS